MKFNSYHPETREYLGVVAAQINPKRVGEFLMPAFATPIALPEEPLPDGCKWQLGDGEWNAVEDHRGETVYRIADKRRMVVDYLGPIEQGFTPLAPNTPDDSWDGSTWASAPLPQPTASDVREEANRRLLSTDWYVTRMAETGEAIPQTISDYRAAVRTASNGMEPSPPLNYRDDSHWPEVID